MQARKGKNMKKTLLTIAVTITLALFLCVGVFAQEAQAQSDDFEEPITQDAAVTDAVSEKESVGIGAYIVEKFIEKMPSILSAISIIMTAVLCAIAKKGLVPALSAGLNKIASTAKSSAENTEKLTEKANNTLSAVSDCVKNTEKSLSVTENEVLKLKEKLEALSKDAEIAQSERKAFESILDMQSGIFHTMIQNSSLPVWKKDEIGEGFIKQKKLIASLREKSGE